MIRLAGWCRWLARLGATAMAALFVTFLVGEGRPNLHEISDQEIAGFGAVALMIFGTLVGWRRDLVGGVLLLGGFALFAFFERGWPPLPFLAFLAAGGLLLLSALLRFAARRAGRAPAAGAPAAADADVA